MQCISYTIWKKNFHWFQKYTVYPKWQLWVKIPILRIIGFADIRIIGHNTLFDFLTKFSYWPYHMAHTTWLMYPWIHFHNSNCLFQKKFHKKHSKLERRSDDNPSVPICRWRKRYFDKTQKYFDNGILIKSVT